MEAAAAILILVLGGTTALHFTRPLGEKLHVAVLLAFAAALAFSIDPLTRRLIGGDFLLEPRAAQGCFGAITIWTSSLLIAASCTSRLRIGGSAWMGLGMAAGLLALLAAARRIELLDGQLMFLAAIAWIWLRAGKDHSPSESEAAAGPPSRARAVRFVVAFAGSLAAGWSAGKLLVSDAPLLALCCLPFVAAIAAGTGSIGSVSGLGTLLIFGTPTVIYAWSQIWAAIAIVQGQPLPAWLADVAMRLAGMPYRWALEQMWAACAALVFAAIVASASAKDLPSAESAGPPPRRLLLIPGLVLLFVFAWRML